MTNKIAGLKLPKLLRVVRVRWRFFLATAIGLLAFWLIPNRGFLISRMLIGWDIGVLVYIALGIWMAASTDARHIRQRSVLFDEGRVAIPLLSVCAAVASLGAIFVLLRMAPVNDRFLTLAFAALTIFLSWSFIQFMFAFHYAHEFYAEHRNGGGGLAFPGDKAPDYWDFLYFSFVVGMTSQVSDVCVTSKSLRRTVGAHGLLSFIFNVALLAFAMNLAVSTVTG